MWITALIIVIVFCFHQSWNGHKSSVSSSLNCCTVLHFQGKEAAGQVRSLECASVLPWDSSLRPPGPTTATTTRCCPPRPPSKKFAECYHGSLPCVVFETTYLEKSSYKHPSPFTLNKTHNNSHHRLKCKTNFWSSKIDEKQTITIQSKYFVHIKNKLCEELKYKIFPQKNPRTAGCATVCHTLPASASSPSVYIMQDFDSHQICCL